MRPPVVVLMLLLCAAPVVAHPIPRDEYDYNLSVELRPDSVVVTYRLEIDSFTLFRDVGDPAEGYPLDRSRRTTREDHALAFRQRMRSVLPDQLLLTLNDEPLAVTMTQDHAGFTDSVQFRFVLVAPWQPTGASCRFALEDLNFPAKKGRFKLKLDVSQAFHARYEVKKLSECADLRVVADGGANRVGSVLFVPRPSADVTPVPPEPPTSVAPTAPQLDETTAVTPAAQTWIEKMVWMWGRLRAGSLAEVLDTRLGVMSLFVLAFFYGAAHSFAPGHGKTLAAAYLVGERGTPLHAALLGVVTTLTHTSSAVIVGVLLRYGWRDASPADVERGLRLVGGLLIALVGIWLFYSRLTKRHEHIHLFGSACQAASCRPVDFRLNTATKVLPMGKPSMRCGKPRPRNLLLVRPETNWMRLLLLGMAGGIIPCWGAVLLVFFCVSAGQLSLALPVVLAFSAGLAGVLILIGLSVVYATRWGRGQASSAGVLTRLGASRWGTALPLVSAVAVIGIGLWLAGGGG